MKVKLIIISIILLLVMVFAIGCTPIMEKLGLVNPTDEEQLSPEKGGPPDGLVKVLIGFNEKPGAAQQAMVRVAGGQIKYTYHIVDAIAASIPEKAIEALQKNPNVRYVEPDGQVYALDAELDNTWGVKRIGAGAVHDSGNGGAGVKVAIIDSGVDYTHEDLDNNFDTSLLGHDFVNNDTDPMDDNGHGTHVAGTVAAEDNGEGVVGVAPEASLYALKVLDSGGRGDFSDVIAALQWCVDNGIQVTNNSYGSSGDPGVSLEEAFDSSAIAGILHVAAAGNSGNPPARGDNVGYPAAYDSVIAVAATDQSDERARWSSTGPDVELAAPGVGIYSTYIGGDYATMSGTSMASPHVAGVAALVIAAAGIGDVRTQLQDTADDLGDSSLYGYGLVNAVEAVGITSADNLGPVTSDVVADPNPTNGATSITLTADVSDATTGNATITAAEYFVGTVDADGSGTPMSASDGAFNYPTEEVTASIVSTWAVGQYTLYVHGEDAAGNWGDTKSVMLEVTTEATSDTMHVFSIDMEFKIAGINVNAIATVTIVDGSSVPVEGATVSGTWSGETNDSDSGVTDASGQVSLQSSKVKNPSDGTTFTFTVDDVTKDGYTLLTDVRESNDITFPLE